MCFKPQLNLELSVCRFDSLSLSLSLSLKCLPSKHAGSDPKAFWLRPVMVIKASVQPESARTTYARSGFPHPFQFRFSKEGLNYIVQYRPGSEMDGLVSVWPNTSGMEASRCAGIIGSGFWQDAVPVIDSVPFFHRRPG